MRNISKFILLFFIAIPLVFAFGNQTVKQIDEIKNNTGTDILLNPTDKVDIGYFSGEKALQSTVDGELEESSITNTELGYLSGVTSLIQDQLDSKAIETRLINTTTPLQGGGDLSGDRTLSILQAGAIQDGYLSSVDWNTFDGKQDAITGVNGDLYYYNSGLANLGIGTSNQFLRVSALGFPEWVDLPPSVSVTTKGDIQTHDGTNPARLPVGIDGKILSANSATVTGLEWIDAPASYITPTTTEGDLILRGAIEDERLPIGLNGQLLTSNGTTASWQDAPISLPDQTGNSGLYLKTNGTTANWNELNNDVNEIKDNLLECSGFDGCAPEGVITNGAGIDLSGSTTRSIEATAFNTSKLNLTQSAAGTLDYTYTKSASFEGKQMVAYCEIKTANTGVTFNSMMDGVVQSTLDVSSDNTWKYYKIPFVGGATSQGFKIDHVTASEIPDIDIDNCFIGKDANQIREIGQAHFVGSLRYETTASCIWVNTSTTWANFTADTDCNSPIIRGSVLAPDTKIPAVKIQNVRTDGYYKILVNGFFYLSTGTNGNFRLSDGTYSGGFAGTITTTGSQLTNSFSYDFRFNDTSEKIINIQSRVTGGESWINSDNSDRVLEFSVHFYPDDTSTIVTQDTELTAKTANEFSAVVSSSGAVNSKNFDFIESCSWSGGVATCLYKSGIFTQSPSVVAKVGTSSTSIFNTEITSSLVTGFTVRSTYQAAGGGVNNEQARDFSVIVSKQGADVNKSATIIGKFENVEEVNTELTKFTDNNLSAVLNGTTCAVESENYSGWIESTTDAGTGVCVISFPSLGLTNLPVISYSIQFSGGIKYEALSNPALTTVNMYSYSTAGTPADPVRYYIRLNKQGADFNKNLKGVVVNASNSATKCQTKYLSANVTTTGVLSDLSFSNLVIGKKYSYNTNFRLSEKTTTVNEKYALVTVFNYIDNTANRIEDAYTRSLNISRHQATLKHSGKFTAIDTNFTSYFVDISGTVQVVGGVDYYGFVELCELPDTYVETTEF